ncbi:Prespore-specific transcriptional regulator RsfA [Paraliobacillus sp. PM-2]|uniref:RsfA family transcriptional regulator n=1 Tax=Paraliobacillus sp. PM-2 TaxID=1462524 RepID=UPI00061BE041|nr:RsfA family transcriptional regulator [Paraliobacillus sp. PM-2]CQR47803.1 Prespore-specific transcriptional regulator RsfA [Paraliobacillus sp. PM-2]
MNVTRQDAWSNDEDALLAETVLRYIREGKTQLEAFKDVGKRVSRTPAACGFRWNASVRKEYQHAIDLAKQERKNASYQFFTELNAEQGAHPLETAISILEDMKGNYRFLTNKQVEHQRFDHVMEENKTLKQKLTQYEEGFSELERLCNVIKQLK